MVAGGGRVGAGLRVATVCPDAPLRAGAGGGSVVSERKGGEEGRNAGAMSRSSRQVIRWK